jgi:hypothetical protein
VDQQTSNQLEIHSFFLFSFLFYCAGRRTSPRREEFTVPGSWYGELPSTFALCCRPEPTPSQYAYIIDLCSVAFIYLGVCNTGEAAEKSPRNRVKRVASYLFHNLTLTFGCIEAKEVFHGNKVRGLHVFRENPLPYSGFIGDRKSPLESILFYRYIMLAKISFQYRSF